MTVKQVFTSKPAGTTRGHYGYVFARAYFDDGTSEEVPADNIVPIVNTPNLFLTAPGANENHAGSNELIMYNGGTYRWLVTLAKTAVSECVETSAQLNFTRCNVPIGFAHPKVRSGPTSAAQPPTLTPDPHVFVRSTL